MLKQELETPPIESLLLSYTKPPAYIPVFGSTLTYLGAVWRVNGITQKPTGTDIFLYRELSA